MVELPAGNGFCGFVSGNEFEVLEMDTDTPATVDMIPVAGVSEPVFQVHFGTEWYLHLPYHVVDGGDATRVCLPFFLQRFDLF